MTTTEIILLILVIVMMIIHIKLYIKFKNQQEDAILISIILHDLLTGKAKIERELTEEEFIKIMHGGEKPNGKK